MNILEVKSFLPSNGSSIEKQGRTLSIRKNVNVSFYHQSQKVLVRLDLKPQ